MYLSDLAYFLCLIAAVVCLIASFRVKGTYRKYSKVRSSTGLTGAQAAQRMLTAAGINDVSIEHIRGELTDHYDPRTKTLRLSDVVYNSPSVAAVSVACHECGHAIQHADAYSPLVIRSTMVPVVNIGSHLSWPVLLVGFLIGGNAGSIVIDLGILLFSLTVLFSLVTLPVEFNASHRAIAMIDQLGFQNDDEIRMSKKVLKAAAMTYVASAAAAIMQLIRLILLRDRK